MLTVTEQDGNNIFIVVRTGGTGAGGREIGRRFDRDRVAPVGEQTAMRDILLYPLTKGFSFLLGQIIEEV